MSRLQACRPVIPVIPRFGRSRFWLGMRRVITATRSITVMEYYFYLRAGTRTNHTERWQALSSRYSLLLGCWPFGFPISLILKNQCAAPESLLPGYGYPGKIRRRKKQSSLFFLRISKVPGVGPGENYTGRQVTATTDGN